MAGEGEIDCDRHWQDAARGVTASDMAAFKGRIGDLMRDDVLDAAGLDEIDSLQVHRCGLGAAHFTVRGGRAVPTLPGHGERLVCVPVWRVTLDRDDRLVPWCHDLVAWRPAAPASWWTTNSAAVALGQANIERAAVEGRPLLIHATPFDWIRSGKAGIVILRWAERWDWILSGVPALRVANVGLATKLRANLERPYPVPPIQVPA